MVDLRVEKLIGSPDQSQLCIDNVYKADLSDVNGMWARFCEIIKYIFTKVDYFLMEIQDQNKKTKTIHKIKKEDFNLQARRLEPLITRGLVYKTITINGQNLEELLNGGYENALPAADAMLSSDVRKPATPVASPRPRKKRKVKSPGPERSPSPVEKPQTPVSPVPSERAALKVVIDPRITQRKELEASLLHLQSKIASLETEITNLSEKKQTLQSNIESLEERLKERESNLENFEKTIKDQVPFEYRDLDVDKLLDPKTYIPVEFIPDADIDPTKRNFCQRRPALLATYKRKIQALAMFYDSKVKQEKDLKAIEPVITNRQQILAQLKQEKEQIELQLI